MSSSVVLQSPVTGQQTTYYEHHTLATFRADHPVAPDSLKTLMNNHLAEHGYDAFVDEVKIIEEPFFTSVQSRVWISGSSPVDPFTALVILAILIIAISAVAVTWILATSAQTIIERFWPSSKFYQKDVSGNAITVDNLAEYITCQRTAYPDGHVCPYCGQVFMAKQYGPSTGDASQGTYATDADAIAAEQAHEASCPWKNGVPGAPPSWEGLIVIGVCAAAVIVGLWVAGEVVTHFL